MTGTIAITFSRKPRLFLTVVAALVISACGGGAPTTENPVTNIPPASDYSGPEPATADVQAFRLNVWDKLRQTSESNRCGSCHAQGGQGGVSFVRDDDVNLAYQEAVPLANLAQPSDSLLVTKVSEPPLGHNCWLGDAGACGDIMTTWIEAWAGETASGGRQIVLQAPTALDPGPSKRFDPSQIGDFATIVHGPYLVPYCAGCHSSQSAVAQQPYFAEADVAVAFEAVQPKMDLDDPASSRLVVRLDPESHNCWQGVTCAQAAAEMQAAIRTFADTIPDPTPLDSSLVHSKALRIVDGTIASGGNRYENAQIALWEFKTGSGSKAYDTSGVDPAIDLDLTGNYGWFGGWGITLDGGKAQGTTAASKKLHDLIKATGEYSIEAWVVPANVTQEMARIVSYSGGDTRRNFTLQQTLYDYDYRLRTTETGANGDPALSTPSADEVLQASLQHVVASFDAVNGRSIYVNGELVTQPDPVPAGTLIDWDDTFALVFGSEVSGDGQFMGTLRLVAIHNRELTPEQVRQNFEVGVGEKFYLLFGIEEIINVATAYILFEVAQYDSWGYLFTQPHFITLDSSQQASGIPIRGMRIGLNGAEVPVSQSYGNIDDILDTDTAAITELGQPLSGLGAIIPLEKGPGDDEFFLTFDLLGPRSYARTDNPPLVITPTDLPQAERLGIRTFDEINATFAEVTSVDPQTPSVDLVFRSLRQSLPAVPDMQTFLSSHQVAIAQLAIQYCDALIEDGAKAVAYFPGFDFDAMPALAFQGSNRDLLIDPLIDRVMNIAVMTQPDFVEVKNELGYATAVPLGRPANLIDRLISSPTIPAPDTRAISKAVCAGVVGSAVTLIK
jgi:hypothetical protein